MGGSCGAGRVSYGNLRSGESGYDRQDDGEKAQEVCQQVLGGGQSRADRDGSEDSRVQLFQGDVPLCLPEERQEPSLRFLPGTSNGGGFHRGFNNRCSSHDYCLVLSNLMQKTKFTPSSLCSFQYFIIYAFRRTSRFSRLFFLAGALK